MTCFRHATTVVSLIAAAVPALAAEPDVRRPQEPLEEVVIIAPYGTALSRDRIAANVQSADAEQIERAQTLDITDFLNRNFASVSINHAQNNPLQPDVNFRGFTASPLLGLPMGLTVYQNGVRVNEPFGDVINWDLIPPEHHRGLGFGRAGSAKGSRPGSSVSTWPCSALYRR